jgi:hypothetical protein
MNEQHSATRSAVAAERQTDVAVLAGGCFWGVEEILRDVPGVIGTEVGYTGGWLENPTYPDTHESKSGHAEAIRVTFDPSELSYEDLLERWFFRLHSPTTLNFCYVRFYFDCGPLDAGVPKNLHGSIGKHERSRCPPLANLLELH